MSALALSEPSSADGGREPSQQRRRATAPEPARGPTPARTALRYLDVVLVLLATGPLLAAGVPTFGYLVGGGAWVLQRALQWYNRNWTKRFDSPVKQFGIILFEAFGRIWLLAGAIVTAGLAGQRRDGLTAAVTIMAAYSIAFVIRLLTGPRRRRAEEQEDF